MLRKFLLSLALFPLSQFALAASEQEFCDAVAFGGETCEPPSYAKSCPAPEPGALVVGAKSFCHSENAMEDPGVECTDFGYGFARCYASPYSDYSHFQYHWKITSSIPTTTVYDGFYGDRFDLFCDVRADYTVQLTVYGAGKTKTVTGYAACRPGIPE